MNVYPELNASAIRVHSRLYRLREQSVLVGSANGLAFFVAGWAEGGEVEGLVGAGRDQLGEAAADSGRELEAVAAEADGEVKPVDPRCMTEEGVTVRRQ